MESVAKGLLETQRLVMNALPIIIASRELPTGAKLSVEMELSLPAFVRKGRIRTPHVAIHAQRRAFAKGANKNLAKLHARMGSF
jgi:hypothetical protein